MQDLARKRLHAIRGRAASTISLADLQLGLTPRIWLLKPFCYGMFGMKDRYGMIWKGAASPTRDER